LIRGDTLVDRRQPAFLNDKLETPAPFQAADVKAIDYLDAQHG